jgi:hypothetical protein
VRKLEFWPDYGGALLWSTDGERVALEELPLSRELVEHAQGWVARYEESKLPWEPTRDEAWLAEGRRLLDDLRRELGPHGFELEPDERFWAEP